MYWEKVVHDFLYQKKILSQKITRPIRHRCRKFYYLGKDFTNIYFTKREAECMLLMLKGKNTNEIANTLKLSPRTIEFYIKNMKIKLFCHSKKELIHLIEKSDFIFNIDFDV